MKIRTLYRTSALLLAFVLVFTLTAPLGGLTLADAPEDDTEMIIKFDGQSDIQELDDESESPKDSEASEGELSVPLPFELFDTDDTEEKLYDIKIEPSANGVVTADFESAAQGSVVTLTLTPDAGYRLKFNGTEKMLKATYGEAATGINIPEAAGSVNLNIQASTYSFTMPDGDVTITAAFAEAFAIIVDPNLENGRIDIFTRTHAVEGESVSMQAFANVKYLFKADSLKTIDSGDNIKTYSGSSATFTMPASDVTVSAEFTAVPPYGDMDFQVFPGDTFIYVTFILIQPVTHYVYYRESGTDNAYKRVELTGNLALGDVAPLTISGLTNGVEYELHLEGNHWQNGLVGVGDTYYATPNVIMPEEVYINRSSADILLGESITVYAEVLPTNTSAKSVTWVSSNEAVATVNAQGRIESKGLGHAKITVTADVGGKFATCDVTVVESTGTLSGGSMIIGSTAADYNKFGGTTKIPLTVIVPTDRPIFEIDFNFEHSASNYVISGISLDDTELIGNKVNEVGNSKIKINNLPLNTADNNAWCVITPKEGKFLEAGQVYQFELTLEIKKTATTEFTVNFGNSPNYSKTVYYYDYVSSTSRGLFAPIAEAKNGIITATWTGIPMNVARVDEEIEGGTLVLSAPGENGTRIEVEEGDTVFVTLKPDYWLEFVPGSLKYIVDDQEIVITAVDGVYSFIMPSNAVTVTAKFTLIEHKDDEYGIAVVPTANGAVLPSVKYAAQGSVVTLVIEANDGYKLRPGSLKVTTDQQQAPRLIRGDGTAENPFTFTMPEDSVTVTAEFPKLSRITIADGIEHGTIATNVSTAVVDELVTITVTPDAGYRLRFNGYSYTGPSSTLRVTYGENNTGVNVPNSYNGENLVPAATVFYFTMPADDAFITGEFTKAFSVTADPNIKNGSVNLRGITYAGAGERMYVDAIAASKHLFVQDSFKYTDSEGSDFQLGRAYSEFDMPASDIVLTAEFVPTPPYGTVEALNFTVIPGDAKITCTFVLLQGVTHFIYYRENGSDDEYKRVQLTGNLALGDTATLVLPNLKNDVEYEFYLEGDHWIQGIVGVSDTYYGTPKAIIPTAVYLNRTSAYILNGDSIAIYGEVLPTTTSAKGLTWKSSNEAVVTVDAHGRIATVGLGHAIITATANLGGASALCNVYVVEATDVPAGGSIIIGSEMGDYGGDSNSIVQIPVTVTVPTNRPIFEVDVAFSHNTSNFIITGISLDGNALKGNTANEAGNTIIRINNLPLTVADYYSWCTITPTEGKFLEAGQVYNFELTIEIQKSATPVFTIGFSNGGNYNGTGYYYDYDTSQTKDRYSPLAIKQSGIITANWIGEGIPFTGTGVNTTYMLSKPADLLWYADQINTGNACRAVLYSDIDLTGTDFNGIGTAEHPMDSMFTGNGYSVTYNMDQSTDGPVGFIRYLGNGSIRSLVTKGTINVTGGTVNAGGIVGQITGGWGSVSGSTSQMIINVTGSAGGNVGGIVGYTESTGTSVSGSSHLGVINASGTGITAVGGIVGYAKNSAVGGNTNGSSNSPSDGSGNVTGRGFVGGIVGISETTEGSKDISGGTNYAKVTALSGEATGGIAGKVINGSIGGTFVGASLEEYGNKNYGDVTGATKYVGGIIGCWDITAGRFASNYNEGAITSTAAISGAAIGGIIGHTRGGEAVVITINTNKGAIAADSGVTKGGVLAKTDNKLSAEICIDNYYAHVDGLDDAVFSKTAPADWLSVYGYSPMYSGTGGDGSAEAPYLLADLNDFLWFTKQVNSGTALRNSPGSEYHVKLICDIDLSAYPQFEGIGTDISSYPTQSFRGVFDGNGHTIHVEMDGSPTNSSRAIFRHCEGATIKNLTVTGFVRGQYVAGVALIFGGGTMENVTNYADIENVHQTNPHGGNQYAPSVASGVIGGLAYTSPDLVKNVVNYGNVTGHNAVGIVMNVSIGMIMEDCTNYGDITGCMLAAGLIGQLHVGAASTDRNASFILRNLTNYGKITSLAPLALDEANWNDRVDSSVNHTAAGIIGVVDNVIVDIINATNYGTIQGSGNNVSGILGASAGGDFRIINSTNNGEIKSTYSGDVPWYIQHINVAGIVANASGPYHESSLTNPYGNGGGPQYASVTGSVNNGIITGPAGANVGAIVGYLPGADAPGVVIGDNYTSVAVDSDGRAPISGETFDPETHKVYKGKLVDIDYVEPDEPEDPEDPKAKDPTNDETPSNPDYYDDTSYSPQSPATSAQENPQVPDTNIPDTQTPTQNAPTPPPPATENQTPNLPDTIEPESNNAQPAQYMPLSRNLTEIEPIVLQLDDTKTPLASDPSQSESSAQDESTAPEDAPPPQEDVKEATMPQMADIVIDPTSINPAFIIIPLIAVIAIIGIIGFIRFRRRQSV